MSDSEKNLKRQQHTLIVVHTTHIYEEAHIIAGKLQSENIPAAVQREAAAGALGITVGTFGAVNVLVRETDYEAALHILLPEENPALSDDNRRIIYKDDTHDHDID